MEESSQSFQRKGIACFTKHGEKNHPPRAVVLWKAEESEVKRSMWLAIKTEGAELEERERVQRAKE
jgi:hypothetical protein